VDLTGQSNWTVSLVKSSTSMRALIIRLSHETHLLEINRRRSIDSLLLDGKAIFRLFDITSKIHTFSISDGQQIRGADLRVMQDHSARRITEVRLIVDGQVLYQES
jgi:hypothetical protein